MTNGDFEDEEMLRFTYKDPWVLQEKPEPHDFEARRVWTIEFLTEHILSLFCANCAHRPSGHTTCAQANCDTLDRVEGRLWKVGE